MKYLKKFNNHNNYTAFIGCVDFAEIQAEKKAVVSYCKLDEHVHYNPYVGNDLPSGYTKLEYIESTATGGQYIETNLNMWSVMPVTYECEIKAMMIGNGIGKDNDNQAVILGNNYEVYPWPGFVIRREMNHNIIEQDQYPAVSSYGNLGEYLDIHQLYTCNGTTHNVTATLFCGKDGNGTPFRYSHTRIYGCKLRANSSTWQRDFIPCLNDEGVAGLYDLVEKKFYSSPNGVAFEYGLLSE